jgi:hypothetical protein
LLVQSNLSLLVRFRDGLEGFDQDFPQHIPRAQFFERGGNLIQGKNRVDHRLEFTGGGPFEGGLKIGAVSAVAADEAMLFHKEWPEIEWDFAAGSGAAGYDSSTASEAIEALEQNVTAHMFDNQINAAPVGDFADFSRPLWICGVENKFSAEMMGQRAFCLGRAGADDASAELFGNLYCGGADATRPTDNENPIALVNGSTIGEHVHGGAAGESQGS